MKTLRDMSIGESGKIARIGLRGTLKQRFLDMGITQGVEVKIQKIAPLGDPIEIAVRGYNLSIRKEDAAKIEMMGE